MPSMLSVLSFDQYKIIECSFSTVKFRCIINLGLSSKGSSFAFKTQHSPQGRIWLTMPTLPTGGRKNCPAHLYQCGSGDCVHPDRVCDRIVHCLDGSDEGSGCLRRNCSHLLAIRCERRCVSTPIGPVSVLHGNLSASLAYR